MSKRVLCLYLIVMIALTACSRKTVTKDINKEETVIGKIEGKEDLIDTEINQETREESKISLKLQIGDSYFTAELYDNSTTNELIDLMPMTIDMSELNGNEKYYYLSESLSTYSEHVGSIHAGDLMLFGSDCLVLFYQDFQT